MEFIISIINDALRNGDISSDALLILMTLLIVIGYINVIKPLQEEINTLAIQNDNDTITSEKWFQKGSEELDKILENMNKIISNIDDTNDISKSSYKEIIDMRRDLETVKQILNQFQGHMMYGYRRQDDFGNKELR